MSVSLTRMALLLLHPMLVGSTWNGGVRVGVPMLKHRAERTEPAEAGSGRFRVYRRIAIMVNLKRFGGKLALT